MPTGLTAIVSSTASRKRSPVENCRNDSSLLNKIKTADTIGLVSTVTTNDGQIVLNTSKATDYNGEGELGRLLATNHKLV